MFGIKVRNQFLDLEQTKFNVKLQTPLMFSKDNKEVIPSSLMLTTKLGPTKRNFLLLENPHLLSNPRTWLKNEPCEIWANGSILYVGHLEITEATPLGISVRILINSVAKLAETTLNQITYTNPTPTTNVFASAYYSNIAANFDNYLFACPRVYNPYQWGDDNMALSAWSYQNNINFNSSSSWVGGEATVAPMPKINAILKGLFTHLDLSIDNYLESSEELKRLLLYGARPAFLFNGTARYSSINLQNHVPIMKSSDFLKHLIRHFNLGLMVSNFDNVARIIKTDDIAYLSAVHDWTKKVISKYTLTTQEALRLNLKMTLPSALPRNSYELKKYTTTPPDEVKEYVTEQYSKDFVVRRKEGFTEYILFNKAMNRTESTITDSFESKITSLPLGQFPYTSPTGLNYAIELPMSQDRNDVNNTPSTDNIPLFFLRDSKDPADTIPVATSETTFLDNSECKVLGQNAQHGINFGGEGGVYEKFWKNWTESLVESRKIEVQLDLTIADLRRFNFDEKVLIGNIEAFVESIDLEFSELGLSAAKAMLIKSI